MGARGVLMFATTQGCRLPRRLDRQELGVELPLTTAAMIFAGAVRMKATRVVARFGNGPIVAVRRNY